MANGRSSQDERKLEGGSPPPQDNGLHPGFYIAYVSLVFGDLRPLEKLKGN
jgi:hypothetical protein